MIRPFIGADGHGFVVECDRCWCLTGYYETEAAAVEAWSTRAERTCQKALDFDGTRYVCSACGEPFGPRRWSYCPNCGAKVVS